MTVDEFFVALTTYSVRAMEKLRAQHSFTGMVSISIRTGIFDHHKKQYKKSISVSLPSHTQDTLHVIKTDKQLFQQIFKEGYEYQQAGITLGQIRSANQSVQTDLFGMPEGTRKEGMNPVMQQALMESFDLINKRFPKKLSFSTVHSKQAWHYEMKNQSPRYTTHWGDLVRVKCF